MTLCTVELHTCFYSTATKTACNEYSPLTSTAELWLLCACHSEGLLQLLVVTPDEHSVIVSSCKKQKQEIKREEIKREEWVTTEKNLSKKYEKDYTTTKGLFPDTQFKSGMKNAAGSIQHKPTNWDEILVLCSEAHIRNVTGMASKTSKAGALGSAWVPVHRQGLNLTKSGAHRSMADRRGRREGGKPE